jgi:hypothetical protein
MNITWNSDGSSGNQTLNYELKVGRAPFIRIYSQLQTLLAGVAELIDEASRITADSFISQSSLVKNRRIEMGKYLSLIGILLVLGSLSLISQADHHQGQHFYVSPALLLGINFDFSEGSGLKFYPSLSTQVSAGVLDDNYDLVGSQRSAGMTFGYQWSWAHPNNTYIDLQLPVPFLAGAEVGWAWQPSTKVSSIYLSEEGV